MKRYTILALPLCLLPSMLACSSAGDVVLGNGELTGTGGHYTVYTGGAPSLGGAPPSGGTTGAGGLLSIPPGASSGGATCSSVTERAESLPTDVYVMFDQSSSMSEPLPPPATGTWWSAAQQALEAFATDPTLAGIGVGLQFFPLGGVAPDSCNADYSTPEVAVEALPGNAGALVSAIRAHQPTTFTPTGPALAGAIAHMEARAVDYPGHVYAVLFVTDGFPTECEPQQLSDIAAIARQGYESAARVRTYVIGLNLGANAENLNLIAEAGGTTRATLIDGSTDVAGTLAAALRLDAFTSIPCRVSVPLTRSTGEPIDISKVNMVYRSPSGQENFILNVLGAEDCDGQKNPGYYFEGSQNGVDAVLCPRTCAEVQPGTLSIVLGCTR